MAIRQCYASYHLHYLFVAGQSRPTVSPSLFGPIDPRYLLPAKTQKQFLSNTTHPFSAGSHSRVVR